MSDPKKQAKKSRQACQVLQQPNAAYNEIQSLRQQLTSAQSEIEALRAQLSDVTGCACNAGGICKYHAMATASGRAFVLRKQAEAVEAAWHGYSRESVEEGCKMLYRDDMEDAVANLRQQADEAEK